MPRKARYSEVAAAVSSGRVVGHSEVETPAGVNLNLRFARHAAKVEG